MDWLHEVESLGLWVLFPFMTCLGRWAGTTGSPRIPPSKGCEHLSAMPLFQKRNAPKKDHKYLWRVMLIFIEFHTKDQLKQVPWLRWGTTVLSSSCSLIFRTHRPKVHIQRKKKRIFKYRTRVNSNQFVHKPKFPSNPLPLKSEFGYSCKDAWLMGVCSVNIHIWWAFT